MPRKMRTRLPPRVEVVSSYLAQRKSSSTARSGRKRRNGGGAVKSKKHIPTKRLLAVGCSVLFAFCILLGDLEAPSALGLAMLLAALVAWLVRSSWLRFREWDGRDPLALRKVALGLNLTALLMLAVSVMLQLRCLSKQQTEPQKNQQPQVPTYQGGEMPDSPKSTPGADPKKSSPLPSDADPRTSKGERGAPHTPGCPLRSWPFAPEDTLRCNLYVNSKSRCNDQSSFLANV